MSIIRSGKLFIVILRFLIGTCSGVSDQFSSMMAIPLSDSNKQVSMTRAWVMDYYADNGKIFINDEVINADARKSTVVFEPIGGSDA